ncbi:hypothetical protein A2W60_00960 [Candidatus Azambacteria bacterium RIFCSPHIGHO2_02_46_12]|uniref:General secretion pathway GspH domain-containing protein n=1 Tax=Candidatus Azambacteria bacterium RIFCSPHIGHO2_02_46_12 TaxID=1797295 RepID=A0A1F5BKE0_9BACT|nr:MAG: hypothetical protein A2W60_00960 [Candidatus Azambacteria bacterium RIFCSPHIGHO2_02_46_12]
MKRLFFQKGFTVIELLVVLGIIVLISASILANYRGQQRESALTRSAQKLALDLRRAQTLAVSSTLHHSEIPYGYGVHFDKNVNSYFIFAKCDSPNLYYVAGINVCWSAYEEKVETFAPESGVKVLTLNGLGNGCPSSAADSLDVIFKPPEPTTTATRNASSSPVCDSAEITLALEEDVTKTKIVGVVSATGEIKIR